MAKVAQDECCGRCGHTLPRKSRRKCQNCKQRQKDAANRIACTPPSQRPRLYETLIDQELDLPKFKGLTYKTRNELLVRLGFQNYAAYLQSPVWANIRAKALYSGRRCCRCPRQATELHHSKYTAENLKGESFMGLHPVCRQCHKNAEFNSKGEKRGLDEANRFLGIT